MATKSRKERKEAAKAANLVGNNKELYDKAEIGMIAVTNLGKTGIITDKFVTDGGICHLWVQLLNSGQPAPYTISSISEVLEASCPLPKQFKEIKAAPTAVVLFAGGGGVECGMVAAGIIPVMAVEFNPEKPQLSSAIADAHEANFPDCKLIRKTVQQCAEEDFKGFPPEPDILWASPMCSHFSDSNPEAKEQPEDIQAAHAVAKAIKRLLPKYFFLENVRKYEDSDSWFLISSALSKQGYRVLSSTINMADYGIPQARKRFIVVASKDYDNPLPFPISKPPLSWYDALADSIPSLPDSELVKAQKTAVEKSDQSQPLLLKRNGRGSDRAIPGSDPAFTITRMMFTDDSGCNRTKFADIWLPGGTVKSLSMECVRRLQTFPDWYKLPEQTAIAGSILGYSVPPKFVELLLYPLTADNDSGLVPSPPTYKWGADGVARGNCAGINVWAVVGVPDGVVLDGVKDSKKTTPKERIELADNIISTCIVGLGTATPEEIDDLGIDAAEELALQRAIAYLRNQGHEPSDIMGDLKMPPVDATSQREENADAKHPQTSAASIMAKQHLDLYWQQVSKHYPDYNFTQTAGYAVNEHKSAIAAHGLIPGIHRLSYAPCKVAIPVPEPAEDELTPTDESAIGKHFWCDRLTLAVEVLKIQPWRYPPNSPEIGKAAKCRPWWNSSQGESFSEFMMIPLLDLEEITEFSCDLCQDAPEAQDKEFWVTVSAGHDNPKLMPNNLCYLFPASSFWNRSRAKISSFPRSPQFPQGARAAADSGGFVATFKWGGIYPYTPAQYVEWLSGWKPEWAATMDYCCEEPITGGNKNLIQHRQKKTTKLAWLFWNKYRDCPWVWVPTVQGWDTADYVSHAIALKPLLMEMQSYYGSSFRVGIGTLCARASNEQIKKIVGAVTQVLPGFKFHLWGVKLGAAEVLQMPQIISFDSAAWDGLAGSRSRAIWENEFKGKITQLEYRWQVALPKYLESLEKKGLKVAILPTTDENTAIALAPCKAPEATAIICGSASAIALSEIRRDGGTQPREKLDLAHIATLKEALEDGAELEPVVVFYDGEAYWLADGFHRCKAYEESDTEDIPVTIHQGTRRDAVLYSVGANAEHKAAKPRTKADKRRAVTMLLNDPEWKEWSDREIARQCKVSQPFVSALRKTLTDNVISERSDTRTYTTKHGTTATMRTGSIGKGVTVDNNSEPTAANNTPVVISQSIPPVSSNAAYPTVETPPTDYLIGFVSNLDRMTTEQLEEVRSRIDTQVAPNLSNVAETVIRNASKFTPEEAQAMIQALSCQLNNGNGNGKAEMVTSFQ